MNLQAAPDYFELSDYVSVLRRRWRTVAVWAAVGLVFAGLYLAVGAKKYTATVLVQVNALPNNANAVGGRTGGPVNMDNEGQAVQSAAVASIVKARIHSQLSVADLIKHIHVTVPPNSTYLQITCDASSALAAQQCANATAKAYLYSRRANIEQVLHTGIAALQAHATKLRAAIERYKTLLYSQRHHKGISAELTRPGRRRAAADRRADRLHADPGAHRRGAAAVRQHGSARQCHRGQHRHPRRAAHRSVQPAQAAHHPERADRRADPRPRPGVPAGSPRQARPLRARRGAGQRPAHAGQPGRRGDSAR